MVTTVRDGIAIKVQGNPAHPHTARRLCTKVSRYPERTYHPERILHTPATHRPQGGGQFERVSWDAALSDIAARLNAIAARDPQAILPYSYAGTMGLVQGESMAARFFNTLGASLLERTICAAAGGEGLVHTLGGKVGMRVRVFCRVQTDPDLGQQLDHQQPALLALCQTAKRNGAKAHLHRPAQAETAEKCHEHIALMPGTDGALALALMHELIQNDWLDHDYLARYTSGWEPLRERALQWPPERAAAICGIAAEQIRVLARDYGAGAFSGEPAAIRMNYGLQRVHGGGNAVRADRLPAGADWCLAAPRRWRAAVQLRNLSGATRPHCNGPTCWPGARRAPSTWSPLATICCARAARRLARPLRR